MEQKRKTRTWCGFLLLLVLLAVFLIWNLFAGSVQLSASQIGQILLGGGDDLTQQRIIMQIRLPRMASALILGGALSVSGYLLQTFFHNPIAGPFVLGISSGAKLAVSIAMIVFLSRGVRSSSALLIGAAFIAGHWLTSRAARRNLPALGFMTFVYGVTAVFLLLISPFAGGLAVTGESIYGIIVLAVVCTLGGHALMTYLLGFVSADVVSFALLAEPIGAAVWALLLFHEKVMPPLMIGGLTVIVGLMLYTYGEMKAGKR